MGTIAFMFAPFAISKFVIDIKLLKAQLVNENNNKWRKSIR